MKKFYALLLASVLTLASVSIALADETPSSINTKHFSKSLSIALNSDIQGVRLGALQQYIRYGAVLNVNEGEVFKIVAIYRNSKDTNVRLLALNALNQIQNKWSFDFLERSVRTEKNERVRQATYHAIYQFHTTSSAS